MNCILIAIFALTIFETEAELTAETKEEIVARHNFFRKRVYPPAVDMREMTWDDALQRTAQAYSQFCQFYHSLPSQRQHHFFGTVGENLLFNGEYSEDTVFFEGINDWFQEISDYNYNGVGNRCAEGKMCGHYTQVVWADSYKVGCGVTSCGDKLLVACHYGPPGNTSPGNDIYDLPYKDGTSCGCKDSEDTCVDKLCTNPERNKALTEPTTTQSAAATDLTTPAQQAATTNGPAIANNTTAAEITTPDIETTLATATVTSTTSATEITTPDIETTLATATVTSTTRATETTSQNATAYVTRTFSSTPPQVPDTTISQTEVEWGDSTSSAHPNTDNLVCLLSKVLFRFIVHTKSLWWL